MALSLLLGDKEIINLCSKITVSGSIKQCARTLKVEIVTNLYDTAIVTSPELYQIIQFLMMVI